MSLLESDASASSCQPNCQTYSLRDAGVWFPQIPGRNLCLNEKEFPQRDSHMIGYRPLIWTLFGGPGGIYLQHLVAISVHLDTQIPGIEFHYDDPTIPEENSTLGRHKCEKFYGCGDPTEFKIDGATGERINAVQVRLMAYEGENDYDIYDQGALDSFKVSSHVMPFSRSTIR